MQDWHDNDHKFFKKRVNNTETNVTMNTQTSFLGGEHEQG